MNSRQEKIDKSIKSFIEDNTSYFKEEHGISKAALREIVKKMFETIGFVSKAEILGDIDSHMESMGDDAESGDFKGASKYQNMATSLVELLEVHNCGSVGGFDKGQQAQIFDSGGLKEGEAPQFGKEVNKPKFKNFTTLKGRIKWLKGER